MLGISSESIKIPYTIFFSCWKCYEISVCSGFVCQNIKNKILYVVQLVRLIQKYSHWICLYLSIYCVIYLYLDIVMSCFVLFVLKMQLSSSFCLILMVVFLIIYFKLKMQVRKFSRNKTKFFTLTLSILMKHDFFKIFLLNFVKFFNLVNLHSLTIIPYYQYNFI